MTCVGKYELLKVNQVVDEATVSFSQTQDVALPAEKPSAETILSVRRTAKVERVEVSTGRVVVKGSVELQVTYVACLPEKPVYTARMVVPFSRTVAVTGALPGMKAHVTATVTESELKLKEPCSREFSAGVAVDLHVKLTQHRELEVLVEAPPGVEVKAKKYVRVDDVVGTATTQFLAFGKCTVPVEKPPVEEVLDVVTEIEVTSAETAANEVVVAGNLHTHVVYQAATAAGSVHQTHCVVPFRHPITLAGVTGKMAAQVEVQAMMVKAEPEAPPSRTLSLEALLDLKVVVVEPKQLAVVTEVAGAATVAKSKLRVESVVGEKATEVVLSEAVVTSALDPPAEKILAAEPVGVTITETEVVDHLVVARGHADLRIIYSAAVPDQGVFVADAKLAFTASVAVEGAKPGLNIYVSPVIDHIAARLKDGDVVVDAAVSVTFKVTETVEQEVVTCIELPGAAPPGTVVQHTVAPGDTFYTLAQRYGTTVEAIMAANPGVDPNNLQVGQVINIPVPPGNAA